jgi:ubiquinone biosynthesis protein COQ9
MLLQATLHHVPGHGWTMDSLARGAEDLGLPSVVHGVFPGGPSGLVNAYLEQCQHQFAQQAQDPMEGSISDRVRALTMLRLELLKPYARRWPEAVALLAVNPPIAFHHLSTLVDDIWFYAGDRSPDVSRLLNLTLHGF